MNQLKKAIGVSLLSIIFSISSFAATLNPRTDPILIFKQVSERLAKLKAVKYHYSREFNYPADAYIAKDQGEMYIEFDNTYDLAGMKFQYSDERGFLVFNNSELFSGKKKTQTIALFPIKSQNDLDGKSPLYNSMVTLRNLFPILVRDQAIQKSVSDTVINNKACYALRFSLQNKLINYVGTDFSKVTKELTFNYQIIVDKSTLLPQTVLQTTVNSQNLNRTDFTAIDTSPRLATERSWFYSNYFDTYTLEAPKVPIVLIKAGAEAPNWELTNYASKAEETLAQHKGKLILLEFWIKNCSYCIAAIDTLNALHKEYKDKEFNLLAINTDDNQNNISQLLAKHPVNYAVLYGDDPSINKNYGIGSFPQVVLISKDGNVLYAGNLNVETIKPLIDKNL